MNEMLDFNVTPNSRGIALMYDATRKIFVSFMERFVSRIKQNSPYDTGHNRDSVEFKQISEWVWQAFTESGYGAFLELGTRVMAAQPYFAPAFLETVQDLQAGRL